MIVPFGRLLGRMSKEAMIAVHQEIFCAPLFSFYTSHCGAVQVAELCAYCMILAFSTLRILYDLCISYFAHNV